MPSDVARQSDHSEGDFSRMSFGDHLDELRSCLVRALLGVALATVLALVIGRKILGLVFLPLWRVQEANDLQRSLQTLSPTDTFAAYLKMSLLSGLILAMPWVFYQAWSFVESGLYAHEKQFAKRVSLASSGLFVVGVLFVYFAVLPIVLQFFISFNRAFEPSFLPASPSASTASQEDQPSLTQEAANEAFHVPLRTSDPPNPTVGQVWVNTTTRRLVLAMKDAYWSTPLYPAREAPAVESQFAVPAYVSFVLMLALAFGIAFETPIVVCFLVWSDLVRVETLAHARRHVLLIIVVVAAVMTPPDVISQLMLAVPMYALFEGGLRVAAALDRRRGLDAGD